MADTWWQQEQKAKSYADTERAYNDALANLLPQSVGGNVPDASRSMGGAHGEEPPLSAYNPGPQEPPAWQAALGAASGAWFGTGGPKVTPAMEPRPGVNYTPARPVSSADLGLARQVGMAAERSPLGPGERQEDLPNVVSGGLHAAQRGLFEPVAAAISGARGLAGDEEAGAAAMRSLKSYVPGGHPWAVRDKGPLASELSAQRAYEKEVNAASMEKPPGERILGGLDATQRFLENLAGPGELLSAGKTVKTAGKVARRTFQEIRDEAKFFRQAMDEVVKESANGTVFADPAWEAMRRTRELMNERKSKLARAQLEAAHGRTAEQAAATSEFREVEGLDPEKIEHGMQIGGEGAAADVTLPPAKQPRLGRTEKLSDDVVKATEQAKKNLGLHNQWIGEAQENGEITYLRANKIRESYKMMREKLGDHHELTQTAKFLYDEANAPGITKTSKGRQAIVEHYREPEVAAEPPMVEGSVAPEVPLPQFRNDPPVYGTPEETEAARREFLKNASDREEYFNKVEAEGGTIGLLPIPSMSAEAKGASHALPKPGPAAEVPLPPVEDLSTPEGRMAAYEKRKQELLDKGHVIGDVGLPSETPKPVASKVVEHPLAKLKRELSAEIEQRGGISPLTRQQTLEEVDALRREAQAEAGVRPQDVADLKAAAVEVKHPDPEGFGQRLEQAAAKQGVTPKHEAPPAPPKTPASQAPVGTSGRSHYTPEARWLPSIEERAVSRSTPKSWLDKVRARLGFWKPRQGDQAVTWTDQASGRKVSAPMGHVEADAINRLRMANEDTVDILAKIGDKTKAAEKELKADAAFRRHMEEMQPGPVPGWEDIRLKAIQEGHAGATPREQAIADAYQNGIMQVPRDVANEHGLARLNAQGMLEPITKTGPQDVFIHAQSDDWMKRLRSGNVPDEAFQIIVDGNKAMGYDISLADAKTTLVGHAKNLEKDTAIEFARKIPFLPSRITLQDGTVIDVLKNTLFSKDRAVEHGLLDSLIEGQAKTLAYKLNFGQDFGETAGQLVKDFRAAYPNHPVPVSRAREMREAFAGQGRETAFDQLGSAYWGRQFTQEGKAVTAFPAPDVRGEHQGMGAIVHAGDAATEIGSKLHLMDLFMKQPSQPFRDLPRLIGWRNTVKGIIRGWRDTTGVERTGRLPERFLVHAAEQDSWAERVASAVVDRPFSRLNVGVTLRNDASAFEGAIKRFEQLSDQARAGKLNIAEVRRIKEDFKLSDRFIDQLKTATPGTQEYDKLQLLFGDAAAANSQFTKRSMLHGGSLAESNNPLLKWGFPLVRKYSSNNLRTSVGVMRIARDAIFKEGLSNAERWTLAGDFAKQFANKGMGTTIDAAWAGAYAYASNLAWNQVRVGLGGKDRKDVEFSVMKAITGSSIAGPAGDILARSMQRHSLTEGLASMSIPGDITNKTIFKSPLTSETSPELYLAENLGQIFPGPAYRKYLSIVPALFAKIYQSMQQQATKEKKPIAPPGADEIDKLIQELQARPRKRLSDEVQIRKPFSDEVQLPKKRLFEEVGVQ